MLLFSTAGRFAMMEVKLAVLMILKNHVVEKSPERNGPLQFAPHTVFAMVNHDILLHFKERQQVARVTYTSR